MSEHKYIWLQPECCADPDEGRHWCQDPDPVECDDGKPWVKYILASEHEALERQLAEVREEAEGIRRVSSEGQPQVTWLVARAIARFYTRLSERLYAEEKGAAMPNPLPASDVDKPEGDTNA